MSSTEGIREKLFYNGYPPVMNTSKITESQLAALGVCSRSLIALKLAMLCSGTRRIEF